jgi:flagellar protein FlaJ
VFLGLDLAASVFIILFFKRLTIPGQFSTALGGITLLILSAFIPTFIVGAYTEGMVKVYYDPTMKRVEKKKEPMLTRLAKLLVKKGWLSSLVNRNSENLKPDLIATGEIVNPKLLAARYAAVSFFVFLASVPAALMLFFFLRNPLTFTILIAPLITLFLPNISYKDKKSEVKSGLLDELPFFAILASILSNAGLPLYNVIEHIANSPIFRYLKKEAKMIERDVKVFGKSPLSAIDDRSFIVGENPYGLLLSGYVVISTSGGSIETYLTEKAKELLNWLSFRWNQYAERVVSIGQMSLMLFFMVPTFLIIASGFGGKSLFIILPVLPILFGFMLFRSVSTAKPKYLDVIHTRKTPPIMVGAAIGLLTYFVVNAPAYISLGTALAAVAAVFTIQAKPQTDAISQIEESLPQFLRALTEYRKVGYDLRQAIQRLIEERKGDGKFEKRAETIKSAFRPSFKKLLEEYVSQMKKGIPLSKVRLRTGSWLSKFTFFMIQVINEAGAVNPQLLDQFTEFLSKLINSKKEAQAKIALYKILGIATPLFASFAISITTSTLTSISQTGFGGTIGTGGGFGGGILSAFKLTVTPIEEQMIYIFVVLTGFTVGLVIGKAVYGTAQNMSFALAGTIIAIISVNVSQALSGFFTHSFSPPTPIPQP